MNKQDNLKQTNRHLMSIPRQIQPQYLVLLLNPKGETRVEVIHSGRSTNKRTN